MNRIDLIAIIICISIALFVFWGLGLSNLPYRWQTDNSFCIEHGYLGVAGGKIGSTLRCAAKGYEPDMPISCKDDSVTGEHYCEMQPWEIENCWDCPKNKKSDRK